VSEGGDSLQHQFGVIGRRVSENCKSSQPFFVFFLMFGIFCGDKTSRAKTGTQNDPKTGILVFFQMGKPMVLGYPTIL